ncbi:MAG: hypothetical protein JKY65_28090 [Planctomycetes bacterium]|nr:hypothetical protein [Planctomycetota bacterium]
MSEPREADQASEGAGPKSETVVERVKAFRSKQRRLPFEAEVSRLVADESNPARPTLVVCRPRSAPQVEVWAELPAWLELYGDPERERSLVERMLLSALSPDPSDPFPAICLRLRSGSLRGSGPEVAAAEVLTPFEARVRLPAADEGRQSMRCLGFTEPRRRHAKACKHVYGLGLESAGSLTRVLSASERVPPIDLLGLREQGCQLASALGAFDLASDHFRDYCRSCPSKTLLDVDERLGGASRILGRESKRAVESAAEEGDVAALSRTRIGFASPLGVLHFAQRIRGTQPVAYLAVTTYWAGLERQAGRSGGASPQAQAQKRLERGVREGRRGASWLRRRT